MPHKRPPQQDSLIPEGTTTKRARHTADSDIGDNPEEGPIEEIVQLDFSGEMPPKSNDNTLPDHYEHIEDGQLDGEDENKRLAVSWQALAGPTATVIVGRSENARTFTIHKALLCTYSHFFKGALRGQFREKDDRTVRLPEADGRIFELYTQWLYIRLAGGAHSELEFRFDDGFGYAAVDDLLRLYRLADFLQSTQLIADVEQHLKEGSKDAPCADEVNKVYEESTDEEPFRAAVVRRMRKKHKTFGSVTDAEDFTAKFWFDVLREETKGKEDDVKLAPLVKHARNHA